MLTLRRCLKRDRDRNVTIRPVSLTSQVCKLMEKIQVDSLWSFIAENDLITCQQHGFPRNCSCITQIIECLSDWTETYDQGSEMEYLNGYQS